MASDGEVGQNESEGQDRELSHLDANKMWQELQELQGVCTKLVPVTMEPGVLYCVAVPIGNISDITFRAMQILRQADIIGCEEVAATRRLLACYGIKAHLVSYREAGRDASARELLEALRSHSRVAVVAGAGTPGVSDPGRSLCEVCHQAGVRVVPVPGASALTASISVAGLPLRRWTFEGFLPRQNGACRKFLSSLLKEERTMIFFEAPHRLLQTVRLMLEVWGNRRLFVGRELTKKFEECYQTTLAELAERYADEDVRGEFVLVVEGSDTEISALAGSEDSAVLLTRDHNLQSVTPADPALSAAYLLNLGLSVKTATQVLTHFTGIGRKEAKQLLFKCVQDRDNYSEDGFKGNF